MQLEKKSGKKPTVESAFGDGSGFGVLRAGWEAAMVSRLSGTPGYAEWKIGWGFNEEMRTPQRGEGVGAFPSELSGRKNDRK